MTISAIVFVTALLFLHASFTPKLTVHLLMHSHLDLGWVYTMDEYYKGAEGDKYCV